MTVFDASALLAFLAAEPGSDVVERALEAPDTVCSAANWSEVAQKVRQHGRNWELSRALLLSHGLEVVPVSQEDGERAAALWVAGSGRSLGDRLCLALTERLDAIVLTADTAWGAEGRVRQIRQPR